MNISRKELHKKFLSLTLVEFMRYLKKIDSREFYHVIYLNVASKHMKNLESESVFNHFFIRTNCRMCNKRTKWLVNEKRYYSFCSLKCKSKWFRLNNKNKPYLLKEDLHPIKMGKRFAKKYPKIHANMKRNFYSKNYADVKREFMEQFDVFNRYDMGEFNARKFYFFLFGRGGVKFCKFCSMPTKWNRFTRKFYDYCSSNCTNGDLRHKKRHGNINSSR